MKNPLVKQVLTHALALIIGLGTGYLTWSPNSPVKTKKSKNIVKKKSKSPSKKEETSNLLTTTTPASEDELTPKGGTILPAGGIATNLPSQPVNTKAICGGSEMDLQNHLSNFAAAIEKDSIGYKTVDLSDCSGMFLRAMKSMEGLCPDYIYPNEKEHRDTRQLGKWFYDNNNLQLTNDVTKFTHLIKPGAVLFYGRNDSVYNNLTIEKLVSKQGIEHVGIVTEIQTDNNGIASYTLFHGRSKGKNAGRTNYHRREAKTKNGRTSPPFGNGRQQVIGIGFVTTPKTSI